MKPVEYKVSFVLCSTRPIRRRPLHRLQPLRERMPVRHPAAFCEKGRASHRHVSRGMLLLWRLCDGLSAARGHHPHASFDEPGEVCSRGEMMGRKKEAGHGLPG